MEILHESTLEAKRLVEFRASTSKARGYFAGPKTARGGVLVLHAWWGLNDFFKNICDRLATEGYTALAPDLWEGKIARTVSEAKELISKENSELIQNIVLGGVEYLRSHPTVRARRIGVVGFSMGAAYALWLSTKRPSEVAAVVTFYGAWPIDFSNSQASYLGHYASDDEWEPTDNVRSLEEKLHKANRPVTFHFYPGTGHWFFEEDRPDAFDLQAARLAWNRTLEFLGANIEQPRQTEPPGSHL